MMVAQYARNCDLTTSTAAAADKPQRLFHLHRPSPNWPQRQPSKICLFPYVAPLVMDTRFNNLHKLMLLKVSVICLLQKHVFYSPHNNQCNPLNTEFKCIGWLRFLCYLSVMVGMTKINGRND